MVEHAQAAVGLTLENHLQSHMMAFDIGANRGDISKIMAARCRQVVAFEPNPDLASYLRSSLPLNVEVEQLAMSDAEGTATFYIDERPELQGLASSLMQLVGMENSTRPIEVETATLDAYCQRTGYRPDFIKIDVEGYEPNVFAGGIQTIRELKPILLFEFWETHYDNFKPWFEAISQTHDMRRVMDHVDAVTWYAENRSDGIADILCLPR